MLVIGMVATISRTAFLALAVMLLVGLLTERRRLLRLWPLAFVLLIAAHTVLPGGMGRLYHSFFPKGGITSEQSVRAGGVGSGRLADLYPALKLVQAHAFFGTGDPLPPPPDLAENPAQTDDADAARSDHLRRPVPDLARRPRRDRPGRRALARRRDRLPAAPLLAPRARLAAAAERLHGAVAGFAAAMLTFDAFAFVQCSIFFFTIAALGLRLAHFSGLDEPRAESPGPSSTSPAA